MLLPPSRQALLVVSQLPNLLFGQHRSLPRSLLNNLLNNHLVNLRRSLSGSHRRNLLNLRLRDLPVSPVVNHQRNPQSPRPFSLRVSPLRLLRDSLHSCHPASRPCSLRTHRQLNQVFCLRHSRRTRQLCSQPVFRAVNLLVNRQCSHPTTQPLFPLASHLRNHRANRLAFLLQYPPVSRVCCQRVSPLRLRRLNRVDCQLRILPHNRQVIRQLNRQANHPVSHPDSLRCSQVGSLHNLHLDSQWRHLLPNLLHSLPLFQQVNHRPSLPRSLLPSLPLSRLLSQHLNPPSSLLLNPPLSRPSNLHLVQQHSLQCGQHLNLPLFQLANQQFALLVSQVHNQQGCLQLSLPVCPHLCRRINRLLYLRCNRTPSLLLFPALNQVAHQVHTLLVSHLHSQLSSHSADPVVYLRRNRQVAQQVSQVYVHRGFLVDSQVDIRQVSHRYNLRLLHLCNHQFSQPQRQRIQRGNLPLCRLMRKVSSITMYIAICISISS